MDYDDRIFKCCPVAEHVTYTCKNHANLRWSGKNLHNRSLFFSGCAPGLGKQLSYTSKSGEERTFESDSIWADGSLVKECACPASDLVHICK